ncbi:insulinase family protein [Halomonas sp. DP8Y7-3]|uniref:insulinase family protein n=1 Tax=Halomonas sp. DP8Y7-3 TaxID=2859079 RepID=UPI0021BDCD8C|nr:insulinase family protein [Halomonas sp. DP8Y7-3]
MASIRIRRGAPCLATALACIWLPMAQAAPGDQAPPSSSAETATATTSIAAATSPIVSPHDDRDYRVLTLDNGLEVLLVSDPEADKAAASLNVSVGSAQDPNDLQGLAHLLEHMLFLGTEAYPEADAYQGYISRHGGRHNAFTASLNTNYFFDVEADAFEGALDRFSRFFVDPLFNADQLGSERNVVHSEYQARLRDDARRENEVLDGLLNPANPTVGFSVGSKDTLAERPEGEPSLRERVMSFYQNHYGANVMHLAVVAPMPLDQLQGMVAERFAEVPNRGLTAPEITTPLVDTAKLPLAAEAHSLRDARRVSFLFPVPDPVLSYQRKPASYIANLIGHEGPGSLLSRLRDAGWADGLSAGVTRGDGQHALLAVDISLTPEGRQQLERIQASLFAAIERIREEGVSDDRYDEQASLSEQAFQFQQHGDALDEAMRLSISLTHYPLEDVNRAGYRMDGLDVEEVRQWLGALRPDNMIRLYSGPEVEGEQRTTYYNTRWQQVALPTSTAEPLDGLALPAPNPFIAEDLALLEDHAERPTLITDTDQADAWYKADAEFDTPKASWRFSLQHPGASQTPRQAVLTQLLAGWLNDSLNERLYAARLAGQKYEAYAHSRGMTLSFTGWRDRQDRVMAEVIDQLKQGSIEDDSVARVRFGLEREWRNAPRDPLYHQGQRTLSEALIRPQWSPQVLLESLAEVTPQDLRDYRDLFLSELHLQLLAVGNLSRSLAEEEASLAIEALEPSLGADAIADLEVLKATDLPSLTPDSEREESLLLRYLQGPDQSLPTQARIAVLGKLLETPFYQRLRTEQQLGYIVNAGYSPLLHAPGISLLVQSPSTPSEELKTHVDDFLDQVPAQLEGLDEATLATYRQAVHDEITQRDAGLEERTNRLWRALSFGDTHFDRRERLAAAVLDVTLADLLPSWQALRDNAVVDVAFDPGATPSDIMALKGELEVLPGNEEAPLSPRGEEESAQAVKVDTP